MLFCRVKTELDLKALQYEIDSLADEQWLGHVNTRGYSGEWSVLPLRCASVHANAHPILQGFSLDAATEWVDLPHLESSPYLSSWIHQLECSVKSVRLMRLAPGSTIKPHRDNGLEWEGPDARLHLCVFSNPDVVFKVNHKIAPMAEGEFWYINAGELHEVINKGNTDRIHIVIDCEMNDWLKAQFVNLDNTPDNERSLFKTIKAIQHSL